MPTLRDDLSLQSLDFFVPSYSINFSSKASEGSGESRDQAICALTQFNEVLFRPTSDRGLHIFETTWFLEFETRGW